VVKITPVVYYLSSSRVLAAALTPVITWANQYWTH